MEPADEYNEYNYCYPADAQQLEPYDNCLSDCAGDYLVCNTEAEFGSFDPYVPQGAAGASPTVGDGAQSVSSLGSSGDYSNEGPVFTNFVCVDVDSDQQGGSGSLSFQTRFYDRELPLFDFSWFQEDQPPAAPEVKKKRQYNRRAKGEGGENMAMTWTKDWRIAFDAVILQLGVGNAKTKAITAGMKRSYPNVQPKQCESFWQARRNAIRKQYGLSKDVMPDNHHVPKDVAPELEHLVRRWILNFHGK